MDGTGDPRGDSTGERRRLSHVRHDERGNAYVEWTEAPVAIERPRLEIQHERAELQLEIEHKTYDPYASAAGATRRSGNTTRTDLRKLSEWIKMMRELEQRKHVGGGDDDKN